MDILYSSTQTLPYSGIVIFTRRIVKLNALVFMIVGAVARPNERQKVLE